MASEVVHGRLLLWATAFAAAALVGLPAFRPLLEGAGWPLVGLAVGLGLFALLAGAPRLPRRRPDEAILPIAWLAADAAYEELLWRGIALAGLAAVVGVPGALVATSVVFALSHRSRQGRRAAVHVATGAAFGAAFVCAGLVAAVAAHASYNALVYLGIRAEQEPG